MGSKQKCGRWKLILSPPVGNEVHFIMNSINPVIKGKKMQWGQIDVKIKLDKPILLKCKVLGASLFVC